MDGGSSGVGIFLSGNRGIVAEQLMNAQGGKRHVGYPPSPPERFRRVVVPMQRKDFYPPSWLQESRYQALRDQIISLAVRYAIPVSYPGRGYVDAGGLISYGTEFVDVYHRCAAYVVRILRGEAPQNLLPSEYATFSDGCTICQTPVTRVGLKSADQALRAPYARPLSSLEKSYSIAREMPAVPWSFAAAESSVDRILVERAPHSVQHAFSAKVRA